MKGVLLPKLKRLFVANPPHVWESMGFKIVGNQVQLGNVIIQLVEKVCVCNPVVGWDWENLVASKPSHIDGIPLLNDKVDNVTEDVQHMNNSIAVDHVVLKTFNVEKTIKCMNEIGLEVRKRVVHQSKGMEQVFFKAENTILEVISSLEASNSVQDSYIWGITFVTSDIITLHKNLEGSTKVPYDAVQIGRKFTTLDNLKHGTKVRIAFISPHMKK